MTATGASSFEGLLVDLVWARQGEPPELSKAQCAARLQLIQERRARDAAEEADVILRMAELTPDDEDPPPGAPGARSSRWRHTDPAFPGVSESFPDELGQVLRVGRGTAAHKTRRAFTWRHSLPLVAAAQRCGRLDERRAAIFADTLQHADPALARRVEQLVLPEAADLGFRALERRIREVQLELDPASADENRRLAERNADVFVQPDGDGMATYGAQLPAEEAAEAHALCDLLAQMAKADGDDRPIGQIRAEIFSLINRGALLPGAAGARATVTINAWLESLEGSSTLPGDVQGFAVTPARLRDLLRRVGALGLTTPPDGSLIYALHDEDGRLLATLSLADLRRAVTRGEGVNPPADAPGYERTTEQKEFLSTRDRHCRMPYCGQRSGWADHDHVVAHSDGGATACTNLCCLCRTHHRLKTHFKGWAFVMDADGTLHVTTPSGVTRSTRPWAMRRPPPPAPPPDDPPPF